MWQLVYHHYSCPPRLVGGGIRILSVVCKGPVHIFSPILCLFLWPEVWVYLCSCCIAFCQSCMSTWFSAINHCKAASLIEPHGWRSIPPTFCRSTHIVFNYFGLRSLPQWSVSWDVIGEGASSLECANSGPAFDSVTHCWCDCLPLHLPCLYLVSCHDWSCWYVGCILYVVFFCVFSWI